MIELVLAAAFLLLSHFGVSSTALRPALVRRVGETGYLVLYSGLALFALVWLIAAYAGAPHVPLWGQPKGLQWVPLLVMPFAVILLVAGLTTSNPSAVGQDKALAAPDPARGVLRITRHPFLWAVGLWGLSHMVANGDLASLVFFGALAALALAGTFLMDHKKAQALGERWLRFRNRTSSLPLAAIAGGRQRLDLREIGWVRIGGGLALTVALLALHRVLFGVPALG